MPTLADRIRERLADALEAAGVEASFAEVQPATNPAFGDYQTNAAMVAAKTLRQNPRELAAAVAGKFSWEGLLEGPPEVAGPGFLNFRISLAALSETLARAAASGRGGVEPAARRLRIVVDFSSPNVAKPMHVGHIRSTILGDCLARVARELGHEVITDNHLGDWGTQFGKVLFGWKHLLDRSALETEPAAELARLYREVNALEARDPAVAAAVRAELVKLQAGDAENLAIWRQCVELSWKDFEKVYELLGVRFDERLGESFYNEALGPLCARLEREGIAEPSEGALCVFFRDIPELADKPALIRKADGGYLYATTDLATIEYRMRRWSPDEIWYVVGAPQELHFRQVFAIARRMGVQAALRHIPFGSILGEDRKIMRTRSGENVPLLGLLEEAIARAEALIAAKNPSLDAAERAEAAKAVGIGAVKYAELSQHRMTDYVFSWEKMLAFQGNTGPYLQNAAVRIHSIFRKAAEEPSASFAISHPTERELAIRLARHPEAVRVVLEDFRPNLLANSLYELANAFHAFYEACPVLQAPEPERRARLSLCRLTLETLRHGLGMLGIACPTRM